MKWKLPKHMLNFSELVQTAIILLLENKLIKQDLNLLFPCITERVHLAALEQDWGGWNIMAALSFCTYGKEGRTFLRAASCWILG